MIGKVSVSILNPGTQVRPHFGPTNARVRLHLGIDVPEGAGIKVGSRIERYTQLRLFSVGSWAEGRTLAVGLKVAALHLMMHFSTPFGTMALVLGLYLLLM